MFRVTAVSSTLEEEGWVALGLLGFSVKICQPCFLGPEASYKLGSRRTVFLHPTDGHNDRHGWAFENSQGRMKLSRKWVNKVGLGVHGFPIPYTGREHPDRRLMPTEQSPSPWHTPLWICFDSRDNEKMVREEGHWWLFSRKVVVY